MISRTAVMLEAELRRAQMRGLLAAVLWFAVALGLATSGVLLRLRGPAPQIICVVAVLLGLWVVWSARESGTAAGREAWLWRLTLFQCWRAVPAIAFLIMASSGVLPRAFALEAGVGDLAIAVTAPYIAAIEDRRPRLFRAWQVAGILDLILVLAGAAVFTIMGDVRMLRLKVFPMAMLPLFLVPLSIMIHVVALRLSLQRLRAV
jgi:hypothetical protein